ncbi:hypothetical protein [Cohnella sp.]|uniref:hypothetical protein n=1 Tax=Cohnella sp. TaxID=1883426 RepID=UPI00356AA91F
MRSRLILLLVISFGISVLLLSCSEKNSKEEKFFTYTVAFNDIVYGFTNEEVALEQIDKLIGENVQIGCNVPECAAPPGTEFYSMKSINSKKTIAVKVPRGNNKYLYYKCVYIKKYK